jgi:hypothetical protein
VTLEDAERRRFSLVAVSQPWVADEPIHVAEFEPLRGAPNAKVQLLVCNAVGRAERGNRPFPGGRSLKLVRSIETLATAVKQRAESAASYARRSAVYSLVAVGTVLLVGAAYLVCAVLLSRQFTGSRAGFVVHTVLLQSVPPLAGPGPGTGGGGGGWRHVTCWLYLCSHVPVQAVHVRRGGAGPWAYRRVPMVAPQPMVDSEDEE